MGNVGEIEAFVNVVAQGLMDEIESALGPETPKSTNPFSTKPKMQ